MVMLEVLSPTPMIPDPCNWVQPSTRAWGPAAPGCHTFAIAEDAQQTSTLGNVTAWQPQCFCLYASSTRTYNTRQRATAQQHLHCSEKTHANFAHTECQCSCRSVACAGARASPPCVEQRQRFICGLVWQPGEYAAASWTFKKRGPCTAAAVAQVWMSATPLCMLFKS